MQHIPEITITPLNENTISIEFGDTLATPTPEIAQFISTFRTALLAQLSASHPSLVKDHVTSYRSLILYYDFLQLRAHTLKHIIETCWHTFIRSPNPLNEQGTNNKIIEVPVYYSEETGPDLHIIADTHKISIDTLIQKHTEKTYRIYAMGFAPGFAYMGFVAPELRTPRLATPRAQVAKGSVGIAGAQTGVYPKESPGGWNIIGRCPTDLIDLTHPIQTCCLFSVGDRIKFNAIDQKTFVSLGGTLTQGARK